MQRCRNEVYVGGGGLTLYLVALYYYTSKMTKKINSSVVKGNKLFSYF